MCGLFKGAQYFKKMFYIHTHTHTHIYIYIYIYIHIHTHTHTHIQSVQTLFLQRCILDSLKVCDNS
jgi:hypothetical protein